MKTHNGEKVYSCNQCDFVLSHESTLKRHKKIHSGERDHKCSHCGLAFSRAETLGTHMRKHRAEKAPKNVIGKPLLGSNLSKENKLPSLKDAQARNPRITLLTRVDEMLAHLEKI